MRISFIKNTLAAILGMGLLTTQAGGADALIDHDQVTITAPAAGGAGGAEAKFTVRLTEIAQIVKAKATVGGKEVPAIHAPIPEEKLQIYALLDVGPQTDGRPYVEEEVSAVRELADALLADEKSRALIQLGIGTIGSKHINYAYTLPTRDVRQATLDSILKKHQAPDPTAEIYRCTQEALDDFVQKQPGEGRKVLFVLTSGHSTDTASQNSPNSLIAKAKKEGIPVFVIAFSRMDAGQSRWQSLRDIAKETGGAFIETSPEIKTKDKPLMPMGRLESSPTQVLFGMLKASASIVVNLKDAPSGKQKMVVEFDLNSTHKASVEKEIEVPSGGSIPPPPPPPIPPPPPATSLTSKPWFMPAIIGGGLLVLGLLAFVLYKATRTPPVDPVTFSGPTILDHTDTSPVPPNSDMDPGYGTGFGGGPFPATQLVIGWLEEYDTHEALVQRHEITSGNFSVGRGSDNSLRLMDESVSMAHATIHRRSDRKFEITDLRSINKTRVNGSVVEHCVLKDGDKILLGKVRLKLVLNTDA